MGFFAGDGLMVFFNDPVPCANPANPAESAVRLAVAMRERVAELTGRWSRLGHELGFGVGSPSATPPWVRSASRAATTTP